jgi:serine/threonine protein kinase/tetratricopeptide (TPR) repeat protein
MKETSQTDELVMVLVERALTQPEDQREAYLQKACNSNIALFQQAWGYVQWEKRMDGFLLTPLCAEAADVCPLEPGQLLINRFRIVREVAQGGMGIVWEAIDEKVERRVAIKCAKAGFGRQLPPEVRNAREISHPNVCKIFEIHTASLPQGEIDFIVMEFLEGETLRDRLRYVDLPKKKAHTIALQLCAGLAEAHRNQVIHGDLKSNNVILAADPDGAVRAVIMDFGLARRPDAAGGEAQGVPAGTPGYMAPEFWKGGKISIASDIYALGVILWELISGRNPAELGENASTLSPGEPLVRRPPTGNRKWDRVLTRCLDPDPARRFSSAEEVAKALGPSPSKRWFLIAAAAAVLAIASGVVAYQSATTPLETVRLAMLPFSSSPDLAELSENLLLGTARQLGRLKSSARTKLKFISAADVSRNHIDTPEKAGAALGATHVLQGVLERSEKAIVVRAYVTDVHTGVDAKVWEAEYKPGETHYIPVALAGVVTGTLHLPPPVGVGSVNAAARKDYSAGLSALRRDSGIDKALTLFGRAVAADFDSPLTHAGLAEAQWSKYRVTLDKVWLNRAAESVGRAQARNSDLARVHRTSGLLKAERGWYEQATGEYLRAIELDPNDGDAYRHLGRVYQRNNELDDALVAFHKAVQIDPQQYRNHVALGTFYYNRANYEEAFKYLRKAVVLAPEEPLTHFSLGAVYLPLGQFASAENELRASIRMRETPIAVHDLGVALMYQRREREAILSIKRALHLGPERYGWWINLGTALRRTGAASESKKAYSRGLDLAEAEMSKNPRSGIARASMAYSCAQLGDRRRAESEVAQALQQSPNDADTFWWGAVTYEALGRRNDTISILAAAPRGMLADLSRWPDMADLNKDSRFLKLLGSYSPK